MADPVNPNRLTPFQAAMLKFEQAVKDSLEAEQAAQQAAARAARQASQPMMMRQAGYPAARQPTGYVTPQPVRPEPMQSVTDMPDQSDQPEESEMARAVGMVTGQIVAPNMSTIDSTMSTIGSTVGATVATMTPTLKSGIGMTKADLTKQAAKNAAVPPKSPLGPMAGPLMQGVVWAEVLGRPVSKRRGKGRYGI